MRLISQEMVNGKTNHGFIIHSNTNKTTTTIKKIVDNLAKNNGVKLDYDMSSMDTIKKGIDSAMCLIVVLENGLFKNELVNEGIKYASHSGSMQVILLSQSNDSNSNGDSDDESGSTLASIVDKEMGMILGRANDGGSTLPIKYQLFHEILEFNERFCSLMAEKCKKAVVISKEMKSNNAGEIIAFLSHMKVEAGAQARLLKNEGERYLMNHEESFKGCRLFLDSDNLSDLRILMDDVLKNEGKKMKVMIVLLKWESLSCCLTK